MICKQERLLPTAACRGTNWLFPANWPPPRRWGAPEAWGNRHGEGTRENGSRGDLSHVNVEALVHEIEENGYM